MKEISIGFLGAGGIAGQHIRSLSRLSGVRVVGICDHNLAKAESLNSQQLSGTAKCYPGFSQMLAEAPMDALYVCIPPGANRGEVEAAAGKGIHLLLEKPMALDLVRAQSIARAVHDAGVKCQLGYHMRHTEPARRLKTMLEDGSAGRPLLMRAHWLCSALHGEWWQDPNMGGGHLIEQVIHLYDLARYFLGDAATVTGFVANLGKHRFPDYRVDDTSAATIRFKSGAIARLCASNSADPWDPSVGATVVCEKILVQFKTPEDALFLHHHGMVAEEAWKPNAQRRCDDVKSLSSPRDEINRNFIASLRENEALRSSIDDGLETLRLVLSVAKSSAAGGAPQQL
jgi:predicted dehydrogenase